MCESAVEVKFSRGKYVLLLCYHADVLLRKSTGDSVAPMDKVGYPAKRQGPRNELVSIGKRVSSHVFRLQLPFTRLS